MQRFPSPPIAPGNRQAQFGVRTGWTLIEMLVTISVVAMLTGIALKTMTIMIQAEYSGIEHVSRLSTLSRLARQFRSDVHAVKQVAISNAPNTPLLQLTVDADRQIQYEPHALGLLRTERRANQLHSRELWRLKSATFQCVESTEPPKMLTLTVRIPSSRPATNKTLGTSPPAKELQIEAVIGRDLESP